MAAPKLPTSILGDLYNRAKTEEQKGLSGLRGTLLGDILAPQWLPIIPQPKIIQDRWFKDTNIDIDGYTFQRCRFDRCSLITEAATFNFESCFVSADCRLYFKGPALKTARLLMHHMRGEGRIQTRPAEETLYAIINPDGTFTLK